jgi:hypothetical protein
MCTGKSFIDRNDKASDFLQDLKRVQRRLLISNLYSRVPKPLLLCQEQNELQIGKF